MTLGSYPITPASDILHELSRHKQFGVRTVQAEDEIAAVGMALGAAFAGHLGVTTTSGPGVALKSETTSLAISVELPLLLVDIQRGGPSTGLPTKTEAADLTSPCSDVTARLPCRSSPPTPPPTASSLPSKPSASRSKYRTPVILLSDGFLANGSEPWRLPDISELPDIRVPFTTEPNAVDDDGTAVFHAYLRDPATLARPWAIPGTPGVMHRIGGLEKEDVTGNISYEPENHELMVKLRAAKVARIADELPPTEVRGDPDADVCVLGWGSTWAAIDAALQRRRRDGNKVAWVHLTHLNPLPNDLGDILRSFRKVIVPELNLGQLTRIVRAEYLVDALAITKVQGLPFAAREIEDAIDIALKEAASE